MDIGIRGLKFLVSPCPRCVNFCMPRCSAKFQLQVEIALIALNSANSSSATNFWSKNQHASMVYCIFKDVDN